MEKLYVLFQDTVGGRLFIEETEDDDFTYQELGGCHANNIFESENEEEVLRKYKKKKKELWNNRIRNNIYSCKRVRNR